MPTKIRPRSVWARSHTTIWTDGQQTGSFEGGLAQVWSDSFTGSDMPDWKHRIAAGLNATTAAVGSKIEFNPGRGRIEIEFEDTLVGNVKQRTLQLRTGAILGTDTPFPTESVGDYNVTATDIQARLSFLNQYRQQRTAFQAGTFFGEIAETLRMLKSPAKALREGINSYFSTAKKRASRVKPHRRNAVVRETYLEYVYGWRPLMNDIQDAYNLLKGGPESFRQEISRTADTQVVCVDDEVSGGPPDGLAPPVFRRRRSGHVSVRYKGAVNAATEKVPSGLEFVGLGLTNFLPTVWNLIPYSFLVDYFSNIGKVIDAASLGTVSLAWGCTTVRQSIKHELDFLRLQYTVPPGRRIISTSVSLSGYRGFKLQFSRAPISEIGVGINDIRFRIPGVDEPFKWLNIGALASLRSLPGMR